MRNEIERLQAKRDALHASLEQIVGQANRVNGAIAVIDELLAEAHQAAPREMLPVTVEAEQESDQ